MGRGRDPAVVAVAAQYGHGACRCLGGSRAPCIPLAFRAARGRGVSPSPSYR